jgi:hypothetical protein
MIRGTLVALVSATLALAAVAAPTACIIPSISQNTDAGAAASSDAGAATAATAAPAAAQGASCTQLNATTALCQFISICPTLTLSTTVFPQCGFRIHGTAIDPECLCDNEYLCPIGNSPTSCAEAAAESTGDVTYDSVCQQYLTGHCTDLNAGTGAGSTTTTACQTCVNGCSNVPSCIEACGC